MGECIISRAGGMSAEMLEKIENIELKDSAYGTVLVTLRNPDGTIPSNEKVQMTDAGGANLIYTTNEKGQCLFKTNSGQMVINDYSFNNYNSYYPIDIDRADNITIGCPVGTVARIDLNRKIFTNGKQISLSSRNYKFSNCINNVSISMSGAGGGAAIKEVRMRYQRWLTNDRFYAYNIVQNGTFNGSGGNGFTNSGSCIPIPYENYTCSIGWNGSSTIRCTRNYVDMDYCDDASTHRWSGVYSYSINLNGGAGGTTSFMNFSAIGGPGGIYNRDIDMSGSGGAGAAGGDMNGSIHISRLTGENYNARTWNVEFNVNPPSGQMGWCNIWLYYK